MPREFVSASWNACRFGLTKNTMYSASGTIRNAATNPYFLSPLRNTGLLILIPSHVPRLLGDRRVVLGLVRGLLHLVAELVGGDAAEHQRVGLLAELGLELLVPALELGVGHDVRAGRLLHRGDAGQAGGERETLGRVEHD